MCICVCMCVPLTLAFVTKYKEKLLYDIRLDLWNQFSLFVFKGHYLHENLFSEK